MLDAIATGHRSNPYKGISHVTALVDLTPNDVAYWDVRALTLYEPDGVAGGKLLAGRLNHTGG